MNEEIMELILTFTKCRKIPTTLRLFLITEKEYIRIYCGSMSSSHHAEEFGFIRNLRFERGPILDLFSKLEFFVNEIIQLKILGPNSDKGLMLDKILTNVDFFSRVKLLNEFGIVDRTLQGLLMETKQVRNGFAHVWDENGVFYKNVPIKKNFVQFKKDMEKAWKSLLEIYMIEQKRIDIKGIITQLKEINKLEESK
jgi:hypothetical protein